MIIAFVVLVCISIILAIAITLELSNAWIEKTAATSALLAMCFGIFVATGAVIHRQRNSLTMWISSTLTSAGTLLSLTFIWGDHFSGIKEIIARILGISLIVGISLAHSGVFIIVTTYTRLLFFTKVTTMVLVWICAALMLLMLEDSIGAMSGMLWNLLPFFMLAVLASIVGTIVVPIAAVSHANKTEIAHESIASRVKIQLACPKCASRQELSSGNVRCANCKASIFIEIEEPRCECGYLLYQLQGNNCPECGRMVPESEKWEPIPAEIDLEEPELKVE